MSMDAVSVWVEHLRVQAVEAQGRAARVSRMVVSARARGLIPGFVNRVAGRAWECGIIAREARRQYQAALVAETHARGGIVAGLCTTYYGQLQALTAIARGEQ